MTNNISSLHKSITQTDRRSTQNEVFPQITALGVKTVTLFCGRAVMQELQYQHDHQGGRHTCGTHLIVTSEMKILKSCFLFLAPDSTWGKHKRGLSGWCCTQATRERLTSHSLFTVFICTRFRFTKHSSLSHGTFIFSPLKYHHKKAKKKILQISSVLLKSYD